MADPRGTHDVVGHTITPFVAAGFIDNVIIETDDPDLAWATDTMRKIGPWRAKLRSAFIHWAVLFNGLDVASSQCDDRAVEGRPSLFTVSSYRPDPDGIAQLEPIWKGAWDEAADIHRRAMAKVGPWGVIDLYSNFEEAVFDLALTYYRQHPRALTIGPDWRDFRKLQRAAAESEEGAQEYERALNERLEQWRRNKLYDGLPQVIVTWMDHAGLRSPNGYETTPEDWAQSLHLFAIMRNSIIHGAEVVTRELAEASRVRGNAGIDWTEGDPLQLTLHHLHAFELYVEQLLDALNRSLVERVR